MRRLAGQHGYGAFLRRLLLGDEYLLGRLLRNVDCSSGEALQVDGFLILKHTSCFTLDLSIRRGLFVRKRRDVTRGVRLWLHDADRVPEGLEQMRLKRNILNRRVFTGLSCDWRRVQVRGHVLLVYL